MMKPEISIIIPAYNEEKYIGNTLQSIKKQNYPDYEVIVVANGCTDKTLEVVKKHQDEKTKLFSIPKPNVSRARNYGAGKARGDLLFFLDADTSLALDTLKKTKEDFGIQHAVATTKSAADSDLLKLKLAMWFKNFYNTTRLYEGCSGALICRKSDFERVNGYDPNIIVKEHRKLILNLKKMGKYTCIDTNVTTSMRRFKEWSLTKATLFWTKQWVKDKFGSLESSEYEKIR